MIGFFRQYIYSVIKMFVNQFAISLFGLSLAIAIISAPIGGAGKVLTIAFSAFSVVFYLFLIYTMTWDIGAKDRVSVDVGKKPYRPHTGLVLSLLANIPNLIIAILYTVGTPFVNIDPPNWADNLVFISTAASSVLEGMYIGLTREIAIFDRDLYQFWWCYFLMVIPTLITAWIAYFAGFKNFRIVAGRIEKKK